MNLKFNIILRGIFFLQPALLMAQSPRQVPASDSSHVVQQALELSEQGKCLEALPLLRKAVPLVKEKDVKRRVGLATVRCAMTLNKIDTALEAVRILNRDFPQDPEVLYVVTHAYSDLSTRASLELVRLAPSSPQARQLNAESLELQGKWDEAITEYRTILKDNPSLPGIHFRIGRAFLSKQETATTGQDAQKEFEEELRIDPNNAGAEYILGELAQHDQQWEQASDHFAKALKIQPTFSQAALGLGMAYVAAGKFQDAIPPLEKYVKLEPANPAGHYQLAVAYNRTGRKEDAAREAELQKKTSAALDELKRKNASVGGDAGSTPPDSNAPQAPQ